MTETVTVTQTAEEAGERETAQQAAVLTRFRELLAQQRGRFQNYLAVLEKQQNSIESAKAEDLLARVEVEEQIVGEISSIQKVIDPLEKMYRAYIHAAGFSFPDDISDIKADMAELTRQAAALSSRNKEQLCARMAEIRREIDTLKNNPVTTGGRRPVYHQYNAATLVDVSG
jgi:sugar-specific transcriptional regulator TrmB